MKTRQIQCDDGTSVTQYIPESKEDRTKLTEMARKGEIDVGDFDFWRPPEGSVPDEDEDDE